MTWTDSRVLDKINDIKVDYQTGSDNNDDDGDVDDSMPNC